MDDHHFRQHESDDHQSGNKNPIGNLLLLPAGSISHRHSQEFLPPVDWCAEGWFPSASDNRQDLPPMRRKPPSLSGSDDGKWSEKVLERDWGEFLVNQLLGNSGCLRSPQDCARVPSRSHFECFDLSMTCGTIRQESHAHGRISFRVVQPQALQEFDSFCTFLLWSPVQPPLKIGDLVDRTHMRCRVAVTVETPTHTQGSVLPNLYHSIHPAVALNAGNTASDMGTVIEINVIQGGHESLPTQQANRFHMIHEWVPACCCQEQHSGGSSCRSQWEEPLRSRPPQPCYGSTCNPSPTHPREVHDCRERVARACSQR